MQQLELDQVQTLLTNTYYRLRNKEISKEQAKCEADLLKTITEIKEVSRIKEQLAQIKSLLTANKK